MHIFNKLAANLAAVSLLACTAQAANADTPVDDAAKLRRLDIMLMVTALRCRFGADNFQADYERFELNQNRTMQAAYLTLQAEYTARMGAQRADKALDSLSVGMANEYGQGHPWLGCGELKQTTHDLSDASDRATLLAAADELLADHAPYGGTQFALRR